MLILFGVLGSGTVLLWLWIEWVLWKERQRARRRQDAYRRAMAARPSSTRAGQVP
jgi:hypothetical protein